MKKIGLLVIAVLMTITTQVKAEEFGIEAVPMAYYSIPLGGGSKAVPSYGLQLHLTTHQALSEGINLFDSGRPAYMDLRFSDSEITALEFNGINTLRQVTRYNANGEPETEPQFDWVMIGGALVFVCVFACRDDDDEPRELPEEEEEEEESPR